MSVSHSSGRFRQASVGVSHHSDRCPREEQKTHVTCQASAPVPLAGTSHVARPRVGAGRAAPTGVNGAGRRCRRPAPAGLRGRFRALEPPLSQGGSSVIGQARAPLLICGGGGTLEGTLRGGRSARGTKGARSQRSGNGSGHDGDQRLTGGPGSQAQGDGQLLGPAASPSLASVEKQGVRSTCGGSPEPVSP